MALEILIPQFMVPFPPPVRSPESVINGPIANLLVRREYVNIDVNHYRIPVLSFTT